MLECSEINLCSFCKVYKYSWDSEMAAVRFCMSRLRAGAGPALSRLGDRSLKAAAGRSHRGWTGGAFSAGVAIAAAHSGSWTAAAAPAPADPFVTADQKYGHMVMYVL